MNGLTKPIEDYIVQATEAAVEDRMYNTVIDADYLTNEQKVKLLKDFLKEE